MKQKILSLMASRLLRSGAWLSAANLVAGLLGYVYQVLMGRMLTPADFALFSAAMSLTVVFSAPLGSVGILITRRVATLATFQNSHSAIRQLYWRAHLWLLALALIFLLLLTPAAGALQQWLKSPQWHPVWLCALLLCVSAFGLINASFLQGGQRFAALGVLGILGVFIKIASSVAMIIMGWRASGALGGALAAALIVWAVGLALQCAQFKNQMGTITPSAQAQESSAWFTPGTLLPMLAANVALAIMTQLDMALVNALCTREDAGQYAAASVLGKAVLYLPGGLAMALFPMVAGNHAKGEGSAHLLLQAVGVTAALGLGAALLYWFLGPWLVGLFYGAAYAGAGELLRYYGFAILPTTLVMVAVYFLLAKGRMLFTWLFALVAPLQILAIYVWHATLWNIVAIIGAFGTLVAIIGFSLLWHDYKKGAVI